MATGVDGGRRRMLALAGAAALSPAWPLGALGQEAGEPAARDPSEDPADAPLLTIPPPEGWSALSPDTALWREEAASSDGSGIDLLAAFVPDGAAPFQVAFATGDATGQVVYLPVFTRFVAQQDAIVAPYQREGGPPMPQGSYLDLRVVRRIAGDEDWLWLGVAAGRADDRGARMLVGMGGLWLDQLAVLVRVVRELGPTEPPDIDGGWAMMTSWAAAIRAANVIRPVPAPAPPRYDLAGVAAVIPPPAGFEPVADDETLRVERMNTLPQAFVAMFVPTGASAQGSTPYTRAELMVERRRAETTRPAFDARCAELRASYGAQPSFTRLPAEDDAAGAWVVGVAESRDSFAAMILEKRGADPGGPLRDLRLHGTALVWIDGRSLRLVWYGLGRTASDTAVAEAWALFRDWVAAVVAANGGV